MQSGEASQKNKKSPGPYKSNRNMKLYCSKENQKCIKAKKANVPLASNSKKQADLLKKNSPLSKGPIEIVTTKSKASARSRSPLGYQAAEYKKLKSPINNDNSKILKENDIIGAQKQRRRRGERANDKNVKDLSNLEDGKASKKFIFGVILAPKHSEYFSNQSPKANKRYQDN